MFIIIIIIIIIIINLLAYEDESVPKRRHIKFRCRGITQKKAYNRTDLARDTDKRSALVATIMNLRVP
jgi:hypothetical protein